MCDPGAGVQTIVEPQQAPVTPAAEDPAAAPAARLCATCQAPMQADQDWCLSCGTAAPGRLGTRPGWRTASSVAALTLVLVVGAVAAAYAALSGDASTDAGQAPPASATPVPGQVAAVPDAPPTTPPVVTPPVPVTPPAATKPKTPKPVVPVVPAVATPVVPATPAATTPTTTTPTTSTGTGTTKTPAPVTLTKIDLGADATSKYEPSPRSTASGDPADAVDGNVKTAWSVTTPADGFDMQVGLLIDLDTAKNVKEIDLGSTTPGGRVEVYGAVGSVLPPDILDTRWEHVLSASKLDENAKAGNVKGDGVEKLRLPGAGATGSRFRYVLLWFTTPPKAGPTMKVTEVSIKG